jgi:hypothetical protein
MRAEINEIDIPYNESMKQKSCFFEKINKIDKTD